MEAFSPEHRDYSSISPSAKALLLMKGYTPIPFARQAAELMVYPEKYEPDFSKRDFAFWARVAHFEVRYRSVDQLLSGLPVTNILELSSGFSFRGLDVIRQREVHYIDTDLPEVIAQKSVFLDALRQSGAPAKGTLELLPLNALDEARFISTVAHFPPGPIAIVNEGLLVYLNTEEKERLCSIICNILKERGGYWITADIYFKFSPGQSAARLGDELQQFLDRHNVEENKFDSPEAAEAFFKKAGFVIDQEAEPDYAKAMAVPYMMQSISPEQLDGMRQTGKIQTTWRLRVA